jgi:DNA-binding ferritin-like protein
MKKSNENSSIINEIYLDYINKPAFAKLPIVVDVENKGSNAVDKAIELVKNNNDIAAVDILITALSEHEKAGFMLGFSYALNMTKEANALMELEK